MRSEYSERELKTAHARFTGSLLSCTTFVASAGKAPESADDASSINWYKTQHLVFHVEHTLTKEVPLHVDAQGQQVLDWIEEAESSCKHLLLAGIGLKRLVENAKQCEASSTR